MNIIKELRRKAGLQQQELAAMVGVSAPTVSEWEHNKKDPTGERLKKLAEIFGVDELVILGVHTTTPSPDDCDAWAIRDKLRADPELRVLFDAADGAKPEHLRAAVAMLRALKAKEEDNGS